ncbi:MAG: SUMF1/EgtB/PvdO family nonheme iron enzyme, partial [Kamptonema sp. SIO4C4]|nr:SUMF1/EgtB/PvdO family nonheme iron enzyme [Kamptonema sp. SIO4C4]
RYYAERILGEGGFGRTFLAVDEDKPSKPSCVIKQFFPQAQGTDSIQKASELFAQEAQRLEELGQHPQIPDLLAYFTSEGRQYLVQEYIEGKTLQQELDQNGGFSETQIWGVLQDLLSVLQFVHSQQIIHRDIKPENIIRRNSDKKLVLVDFGAAKSVQPLQRSVTGTQIGSAEYCSPEQNVGKAKFISDLYSLGVTCLHLLTQESPFELYDVMEAEWVWRDFLQGNGVSDKLGQILDQLVETKPKKRYQSVKAVLEAINPQSASSPQPAPTPQISSFPPTPQPRSRLQTFSFEVIKVNREGREINRKRKQAEYYPESLGRGINLEMVQIPGGTFQMGSPNGKGGNDEHPQHRVTVQSFFMGKTPITQAQWQAVVTQVGKIERDLNPDPSHFKGNNRPVECVSWYDAVEFCARLSKLTGKEYRLPREAEWEYACRAGTETPFHFGETITGELANYDASRTFADEPKGDYRKETTPVDYFPYANGFGLYDMHGNVLEWCLDPWHDNYEGAPRDGTVWDEQINKNDNRYQKPSEYLKQLLNSGSRKIVRGGSWRNCPRLCRSAYRLSGDPVNSSDNIGLRVVRSLPRTL